jgi:phenylacetate-coenzyme A ligase PaaK-like adenylate-forming protein
MMLTRRLAPPLFALCRAAANWRHGLFPELAAGELRRFETLDAEAQTRVVVTQLGRVLQRAYDDVPFYRRRFDAARLRPADVRTPADLAALPLLSRDDVRENAELLMSRAVEHNRFRWNASGGSTGAPLRFIESAAAQSRAIANELRTWRWYGWPRGTRIALIWGADRDVAPHASAADLRNRLLGVRPLNAFYLDEERCRSFAAIVEEVAPVVIYGYGTALARLARFVATGAVRWRSRPLAIRSTAEVLVPADRALIEAALGGPVYDYYGARDAGPIAGECHQRDGLHVFSDVTWVEIVRADGSPCAPGEVGEVVITKLHEHLMPFIRYRTGDRATFVDGDCACGRRLRRLSSLQGRVGDLVRAPAGHEIHGEFFAHLFYGVGGVARFQVRQVAPQKLLILVEPAGTPDAAALERVRAAAAERFGARTADDVELRLVEHIVPGPSGKHRFVLPLAASTTTC